MDYSLRDADLEALDYSKFGDYSKEELDAVKQALKEERDSQKKAFESLPLHEKALVHGSEAIDWAMRNPHISVPAGLGTATGVGYLLGKRPSATGTAAPFGMEDGFDLPDYTERTPEAPQAQKQAPTKPQPITEQTPTAQQPSAIEQRRLSRLQQAQQAINNPPPDTGALREPTPTTGATKPQAVSTEIPSITSPEGAKTLTDLQNKAAASKAAMQPVAPPQAPVATPTPPKTPPGTAVNATPATVAPTKAEAEAAKAALAGQRMDARLKELVYRPDETAAVKKYITENPLDPKVMNWLHSNMGPETAKVAQGAGLGPKSPLEDAYAAARAYREGKLPVVPRKPGSTPLMGPESKRGGESFGKPPANWLENQRGQITPSMALNLLGNALGIVGNVQAYKHGKKTGDYSDLGMGVLNQIIANAAPKAALPLALMNPSALNTNEAAELEMRRRMSPTMQ